MLIWQDAQRTKYLKQGDLMILLIDNKTDENLSFDINGKKICVLPKQEKEIAVNESVTEMLVYDGNEKGTDKLSGIITELLIGTVMSVFNLYEIQSIDYTAKFPTRFLLADFRWNSTNKVVIHKSFEPFKICDIEINGRIISGDFIVTEALLKRVIRSSYIELLSPCVALLFLLSLSLIALFQKHYFASISFFAVCVLVIIIYLLSCSKIIKKNSDLIKMLKSKI